MRILFLSHYALPHIGGIETVIASLSRELRRRGHEVVHVASGASHPDLGPHPAAEDAEVIRVPAANQLEDRLGVPYPIFSPALAGVIRREVPRADVVHAHGYLYMSSVAGLRYAKLRSGRAGGPLRVLTEHVGHVPYKSPLLNRLERAAIQTIGRGSASAAEGIVLVNRKIEPEVAALAPRRPTFHIPNGVDTDRFRPALDGEREALRRELGWDERPRALFVGRLVAKKGLDTALAAAAAGRGSFELVIAGPGPLQPVGAAGARVLGPVVQEEVARLYRAADVLLLPSHGEGFPVVVQEAMASGLPVVMADDPSYDRFLNGAGDGVRRVAPVPEEIVRSIEAITSDRGAWEEAGRAVSTYARAAFTWPGAVDRHEQVYAELWQRRRAQATTASARGATP